ncbi:3-octaprenyl-4-hydroxybenzoate carboxy-lyase [Blastopirellula marina]|uniref:Flavin prenyltransferase UbiX n=1 Tax=Blastopirellula marina TaxID=124 RepID=A0A2S8F3M2_9BACT|nr:MULTISPECIES: flavin prenyltransferase UbiX [Pirellulaceae]PQO26717.1 3-octaprenyl-4-hydroxybenzoate carboxy-lyase [Blastopirellula marina]RCS46196.1 UbiX family flavin prenyltransferase [Bremerella cremea]
MSLPVVVAITGASGAVYAQRLLNVLHHSGYDVQLSISPSGKIVFEQEMGIRLELDNFDPETLIPLTVDSGDKRLLETIELNEATKPGCFQYYHYTNFMSPMASGSARSAGMIVCPCSGGTLAGIVNGTCTNLIQRAAEVHLKERRKLILVPRETPLSLGYIDNMKRATEAGAVVMPAMPGWYHGVNSLDDLIDFMVARILDQLEIPHALMQRWGEDA